MPSEETIVRILRQLCKEYFSLNLNALTFKESLHLESLNSQTRNQLIINFDKANPQLAHFEIPDEHKLLTSVVMTIISSIDKCVTNLWKLGIRSTIGNPNGMTYDPSIKDLESNNEGNNINENDKVRDKNRAISENVEMIRVYYPMFRSIVNYLLKADPDHFETPFLQSTKHMLIGVLSEKYDIMIPDQ